jgi:hypothetical protein
VTCCKYDEFYRDEGILTPVHECPAAAPLEAPDFGAPLTQLERELMGSLDLVFGLASGRVVKFPRRWS